MHPLNLLEVDEPRVEMSVLYMEYNVIDKASDNSRWTEKINPIRYVSHHTHIRYTGREDTESRSTLKVNTLNFS